MLNKNNNFLRTFHVTSVTGSWKHWKHYFVSIICGSYVDCMETVLKVILLMEIL